MILSNNKVRRIFSTAILCLTIIASDLFADATIESMSDASGLFNERGYVKSNSLSMNRNEIISEFNGNLIYEQNIKYLPLSQNGLKYDLKLSYNGSVGHLSYGGYENLDLKRYSINTPEWIISLNGIAIQTFNFENDMVTWNSVDSIAEDNEIVGLIRGYHYCYTHVLENETYPRHGVVNLLMADGSIRQLYSDNDETTYPYEMIHGTYNSRSKEDPCKGIMYRTSPTHAYFILFTPNGEKITYQIYKPIFKRCISVPQISDRDWPDMFLPIKYEDNMGHIIELAYSFNYDTDSIYGRPLLISVGDIDLIWPSPGDDFNQVELVYDSETIYTIEYEHTPPDPTWSVPAEHVEPFGSASRSVVTKITDALNRTNTFEYRSYLRKYLELDFAAAFYYEICDSSWVHGFASRYYYLRPWRLFHIGYSDGGNSFFGYYQDPATQFNGSHQNDLYDTLDVNYQFYCSSPPYNELPCRKSSEFEFMGRDPFFTNMVVAARRTQVDTSNLISLDTMVYGWDDKAPTSKISEEDSLYTYKYSSKDCNINNSNQQVKVEYNYYKYYPIKGPFSSVDRDRGWQVKLIQKKLYEKNHPNERVVSYGYDWYIAEASGDMYKGSLKLKSKTTQYSENSGSLVESFYEDYDYDWDGSEYDETVINMTAKYVTDPWGLKKTSVYNTSYFEITDTLSYYSNSHVNYIKVEDTTDNDKLLSLIKYLYYDGSTNDGYKGQLRYKREMLINNNGSITDSIVTENQYYKNAYNLMDNGALRKTVSPLGDSTLFYYHEVNPDNIEYYKVDLDWQVSGPFYTTFSNNGPFWYKQESFVTRGTSVDTITSYRSVDKEGKLLESVSPNKFLSEVHYDDIDRVKRIVLPGGFEINKSDNEYSLKYTYVDDPSLFGNVRVQTDLRQSSSKLRKTQNYFDGWNRKIIESYYNGSPTWDSLLYSYDFNDRTISKTDELEYETLMAYDHFDQSILNTFPDPAASTTQIEYSITDTSSLGFSSSFDFTEDFLFREKHINENGDSTIKYTDLRGDLRLLQTFPNSNTTYSTYFDYDKLGNLTLVIRPKGDSVQYSYNNLGWLLEESAADFLFNKYVYNKKGQLIRKNDVNMDTSSYNSWLYYEYDELDRLIESGKYDSTLNIRTANKLYYYDQDSSENSVGRLSLTYAPDSTGNCNYAERYHYDARGNIIKQINYFKVDSLVEISGEMYPSGGDSLILNFEYNLADQVVSISYPDTKAESDTLIVLYTYDNLGRLRKVGFGSNDDHYASMTYTDRNNLETMILHEGLQTVNYVYNERGWLKRINDGFASGTIPDDLFVQELFYYNYGGWLTGVSPQYNGNLYGQKISMPSGSIFYLYEYDGMDRLKRQRYRNGTSWSNDCDYTMDENGNIQAINYYDPSIARDSFEIGSPYQYYTNQMTRRIYTKPPFVNDEYSYLYDFNGNLSYESKTNTYFYYDFYNRLYKTIRDDDLCGQLGVYHHYNASDERIYKRFNYCYLGKCNPPDTMPRFGTKSYKDEPDTCMHGATRETFYVRAQPLGGKIIAEFQNDLDSNFRSYIYAGDQNLAFYGSYTEDSAKLFYYLNDHLGTPRVIFCANDSNVVQEFRHFPYGERKFGSALYPQSHQFTGQELDREGGLDIYNYGARFYDPELRRFMAVDPAYDQYPNLSPYVYCADNPLKYTDPSGKFISLIIRGALSIPWARAALTTAAGVTTALVSKYIIDNKEEIGNELSDVFSKSNEDDEDYKPIEIPEEDQIPRDELNPPEKEGYAPTDKKTGKPIEIHHKNQNRVGPFEEMRQEDHRGPGKQKQNHPKKKSGINRNKFAKQRRDYWKKVIQKVWGKDKQ